jgi:hypothetical protein
MQLNCSAAISPSFFTHTQTGHKLIQRCASPSGEGNWYARQGMAARFVEQAKAEELANEIAQRVDEDE